MALSKEYLENPAMSQSKLKVILEGIEEFKYNLDQPTVSSDEQNLGTAVHTLVLEPHKADTIVALPKYAANTRKGKILNLLREGKDMTFFNATNSKVKKQGDDFYEIDENEELEFLIEMHQKYALIFKHPEKYLFLSESDYEKAHAMARSVRSNSYCSNLLQKCTAFEHSHYFTYKGIDFKAQLDGEGIDGVPFILDLKTTNLPNNKFILRNEIRSRGYHFQAATYMKTNPEAMLYIIIFVRNKPPYSVFPKLMPADLLEEGQERLDKACDIYLDCLMNNPEFIADNELEDLMI
jgi:hypothetical protein